jgi:hypothetical protein
MARFAGIDCPHEPYPVALGHSPLLDNKECRVGIDLEEGELGVDFDGRKITYGFGALDELVLAYATTIHKSQGSEYRHRPWSSR